MRIGAPLILIAMLTSCGQDFASSRRGKDSGELGGTLPGKNFFKTTSCSKERNEICAVIEPGLESGVPRYKVFANECEAENHGHFGYRNESVCAIPLNSNNNSGSDNQFNTSNQGSPQYYSNICIAVFEGATITDLENCENQTGPIQFQADDD